MNGVERSVIFDFGAVLFQWRPFELLQQVVPELAPNESAAKDLAARIFESFTPQSDWAQFDLGQVDEVVLAQRIAHRIAAPVSQVRAVIDAIPGHLQPQRPTLDLLEQLRVAGHRLYFLSNMPKPYADALERDNAFLRHFEDGIFSGRVGLMKPAREIFELADRRFGLDPSKTVFIDDHMGNIQAAQQHGWQAVHFTDAPAVKEQLRATGWLVS